MSGKKKQFDVWVRRDYSFTATIKADSIAQALEIASKMSIDDLVDAPGDLVESEHRITGVMEA